MTSTPISPRRLLALLVLSIVVAAAWVGAFAGCTAVSADDVMRVYFLSPQVLTRTAVAAAALKDERYLVSSQRISASLKQKLLRVLEETVSVERDSTEGGGSRFDYRLCIDREEIFPYGSVQMPRTHTSPRPQSIL